MDEKSERKPGQVKMALAELNEASQELGEELGSLVDQLQPICLSKPSPGGPESDGPIETKAELAGYIEEQSDRLRRMVGVVRRLKQDIEL